MQFPDTISTQITERIMLAFSSFSKEPIIKVTTSEYNRIFSHVYKTIEETGINERFNEQYNSVEEYKKSIRKRHEKGVEGITDLFPNGMYTKDDEGNEIGIDVIMKTNIRNLIELSKEQV